MYSFGESKRKCCFLLILNPHIDGCISPRIENRALNLVVFYFYVFGVAALQFTFSLNGVWCFV